jgi:hypothetical protein
LPTVDVGGRVGVPGRVVDAGAGVGALPGDDAGGQRENVVMMVSATAGSSPEASWTKTLIRYSPSADVAVSDRTSAPLQVPVRVRPVQEAASGLG